MAIVDTYAYTAWNVGMLLLEPVWYRNYEWYVVYPCLAVISVLSLTLDWTMSKAAANNRRVLNKNGFSDADIYKTMAGNLLTSALGGSAVLYVVVFDVKGDMDVRLDAGVIANVAVALVVTELMFTAAHRALHLSERLAPLHVMHHCCTTPSWSTNVIFHPVDLMLEFTAPLLAIVALHYTLFNQDSFTSCCAFLAMYTWYSLDHDANVRLPHITKHHRYIDSTYTIYVDMKTADPKADRVKALIQQ